MREYLRATDVAKPEHLAGVSEGHLGRTRGLMEMVRTQMLAENLGGLLHEAERVLSRLVQGTSRSSDF